MNINTKQVVLIHAAVLAVLVVVVVYLLSTPYQHTCPPPSVEENESKE